MSIQKNQDIKHRKHLPERKTQARTNHLKHKTDFSNHPCSLAIPRPDSDDVDAAVER